ncbi:hypothetical protein BJ170DRAFT_731243 [Xylariales sp. AK1849]|nr:hypothetical protein BJ170DRAFT_731243 [Xylariales sp. AK1849]
MADPLSVAGSAVGIVSFGISWMAENKRTEIMQQVQSLIPVFYSLNDILAQVQNTGISDVQLRIQENVDQLGSLQHITNESLSTLQEQITKKEWNIKDLERNISGQLSLFQNEFDSRSLATIELLQRIEAQPVVPGLSAGHESRGLFSTQHPPSRSNATTFFSANRLQIRSSICHCPSKGMPSNYSMGLCGVAFRLTQQQPIKHSRRCRLYGVEGKPRSTIEADLRFKTGWLLHRIGQVFVSFFAGSGGLGLSVLYKSIVPYDQSPVCLELQQFRIRMRLRRSTPPSAAEVAEWLKETERAIISLYRDGKASPSDRDDRDASHAELFFQTIIYHGNTYGILSSDHSTMSVVIQVLQTLIEASQTHEETICVLYCLQEIWNHISDKSQQQWISGHMLLRFLSAHCNIYPFRSNVFYVQNVIRVLKYVPEILNSFELPPIGRAILTQSLTGLEGIIAWNPHAPMETVLGLTTVQLCVAWPQGLRRLLATRAKTLIDVCQNRYLCQKSPIQWAAELDIAESVYLLMKAGCVVEEDFAYASKRCVAFIASEIARRRSSLLKLAPRRLDHHRGFGISDIEDVGAADLCRALDEADIMVPRHLRVPYNYTSIYHQPSVQIHHFSIYFEKGIRGHELHDDIGLTPVMIDHKIFYGFNDCSPKQSYEAILWLQQMGFLDKKPRDPQEIGLNIHANGWHYISVQLGIFGGFGGGWLSRSETSLAWKVVNRIFSISHSRDECICWCICSGKGCSPLKSLWKAYIDSSKLNPSKLQPSWEARRRRRDRCMRHILLYHSITSDDVEDKDASNMALELVRFLTFETLELMHTCCNNVLVNRAECRLDRERSILGNIHDSSDGLPPVIALLPSERVHQIRSEESEQQARRQLETLMEEFSRENRTLTSPPKALEAFIWGYWRRRMSELFIVKHDTLNEIEQVLNSVRTYVVPDRLQILLGADFDWIRTKTQRVSIDADSESLSESDTADEEGEETSSVEDIDLNLPSHFYTKGEDIDDCKVRAWHDEDGEDVYSANEYDDNDNDIGGEAGEEGN